MSDRRDRLISAWPITSKGGDKRSALVGAVWIGFTILVASAAVIALGLGLMDTRRVEAGTNGIGMHCPPDPTPTPVPPMPRLALDLTTSAQVVNPGTEVTYAYVVSYTSHGAVLADVVVVDSGLGLISPVHFRLAPGQAVTLTVQDILTENRTNVATVTGTIEGYGDTVSRTATATVHVIDGILLTYSYTVPAALYHGDAITFYYSVINRDKDDAVVSGTIILTDTLSRTLATFSFDLVPNGATRTFSRTFSIPRDASIALSAIGWDDVQGVLSVTGYFTCPFCAEDIFERDFDEDTLPTGAGATNLPRIISSMPQEHDFYQVGDEDWAWLEKSASVKKYYTFTARPLLQGGVAISLALFDYQGECLASASNLDDVTSDVRLSVLLPPGSTSGSIGVLDTRDYFLRAAPAAGQDGCWTDYVLSMKEALWTPPDDFHVWLPVVVRDGSRD